MIFSDINHKDDVKTKQNQLRRVQSEKTVNANMKNMKQYDTLNISSISDEETDHLSHYESLNLGLSFPETDDDFSDQEDEMLLIQHLNVLPNNRCD